MVLGDDLVALSSDRLTRALDPSITVLLGQTVRPDGLLQSPSGVDPGPIVEMAQGDDRAPHRWGWKTAPSSCSTFRRNPSKSRSPEAPSCSAASRHRPGREASNPEPARSGRRTERSNRFSRVTPLFKQSGVAKRHHQGRHRAVHRCDHCRAWREGEGGKQGVPVVADGVANLGREQHPAVGWGCGQDCGPHPGIQPTATAAGTRIRCHGGQGRDVKRRSTMRN